MKKNQSIRYAIMAAFVAACGASGAALAGNEVEPNYGSPLELHAQPLSMDSAGAASVYAIMGALTGAVVGDVDVFSFKAYAGNVLTIDIDGGIKASGTGQRSVDTILTVLGPAPTYALKRQNDDSSLPAPYDPGSISRFDAYIENFTVEVTGVYYVGVTAFSRRLGSGGVIIEGTRGTGSNGDYTLVVSGVVPDVQQINIDIKPGSDDVAPINLKSRGSVPVALLSSAQFDALTVDASSLTFGGTGDERSWQRCGKDGTDVNGDGLLDLVCHFANQEARFDPSSFEAILKGKTKGGAMFEGRGLLKVVPVKRTD